jgi:hypothetical protein
MEKAIKSKTTLWPFIHIYNLIFIINVSSVTHSTWLELMELMSAGHFLKHLYVGTCQWGFGIIPENGRSGKHIKFHIISK